MQFDTVRVLEAGDDALTADIACALQDIRNQFAQARARVQAHVFTYPIIKES